MNSTIKAFLEMEDRQCIFAMQTRVVSGVDG